MENGTPKQQIVERIKTATNILVTVSRDPSVDELSAALALTLMLNKLEKHATAVFSGKVPPAITFLEPNKTFENTVDSLRDFIIALDKNKADRLRYKVEDDVVRIFITPYKTTITEKDLQFSQGDFNVELIVALGVESREDLDTAITAHGRILHDAATVTLNTTTEKNSLGVVDWQEADTSSLCEMLLNVADDLGGNLLDEQIATALLTGIVSATQRFKNVHTSPKVMTMAAKLMAAGANQQLIAAKLEEAQEIPKVTQPAKDGTKPLDEGKSKKLQEEAAAPAAEPPAEKKPDGELDITHEGDKSKEPAPAPEEPKPAEPQPEAEPETKPELSDNKENVEEANKELDDAIAKASAPVHGAGISVNDLKKDLDAASKEFDQAAQGGGEEHPKNPLAPHEPQIKQQSWRDQDIAPPTMGGTLNATAENAEEEKREEEIKSRNHTILTHDKPMGEPENAPSPFNSYAAEVQKSEPASVDPFNDAGPLHGQPIEPLPPKPEPKPEPPELPEPQPEPASEPEPEPAPLPPPPAPTPPPTETIADLEASHQAHPELGHARKAVEDALNSLPFDPAHHPADSLNAEPLSLPHIEHTEPAPEPPHFTPPPEPPMAPAPMASPAPAPLPPAPLPPPPPMPDFSNLPPLPPAPVAPPAPEAPAFGTPIEHTPEAQPPSGPISASPLPPIAPPASPPPATSPNDPAQFKIPGQ